MAISTEKTITNIDPCSDDDSGVFSEELEVSPLVIRKPSACSKSDPTGFRDLPSSYQALLGYGTQMERIIVTEL